MIQKITSPDVNERVETGPLQINEDWPGLFIRGDNAAYYAMCIRNLVAVMPPDFKEKYAILIAQVEGLQHIIEGEVIQHG